MDVCALSFRACRVHNTRRPQAPIAGAAVLNKREGLNRGGDDQAGLPGLAFVGQGRAARTTPQLPIPNGTIPPMPHPTAAGFTHYSTHSISASKLKSSLARKSRGRIIALIESIQ